jgi:hypothetical protein
MVLDGYIAKTLEIVFNIFIWIGIEIYELEKRNNEKHLNTHISECFLFYLKVKLCGLFLKLKKQIHRSQKKEVCERNGKKLIIY